jgi:hypothetical protein
MTNNSGAHEQENAAARHGGRCGASLEGTFRQCFRNAIAIPSPMMMEKLRDATRQLAEAMRDDGDRPEQALVALKALLRDPRETHWTPSLAIPDGRIHVEAQVYSRLFAWWLSAHFARPPGRAPTMAMQTLMRDRYQTSGSLARWSRQATADAQ